VFKTIKHKFKAIPTVCDGYRFDSKKEANRYLELKELQRQGKIIFFLRQTPFHLPGPIRYVTDFTIFWADNTVTFEDVKGFKTSQYKTKKKMVEAFYPIKIVEV
jgi:hypothetical protein